MAGGISSTTLNLRFMQNAQRVAATPNTASTAAAEKAQAKDESQWEVSAELKEAWGIGSRARDSSEPAVTHESSYLPFLWSANDTTDGLPAAATGVNLPIKGRRTWDKRGREIMPEDDVPEAPPADASRSDPPRKLKSISGSGYASVPTARAGKDTGRDRDRDRDRDKPKSPKKAQKPVRELIREDASRPGRDLRAQLRAPAPAAENGFLKPAGVDEAPAAKPKTTSPTENAAASTQDSLKRALDAGGADGEAKKRKTKKKGSE
ncbi:hypothetical protein EVG20_g5642 [Dentipellis fragilis]|uniref:Uncharacterized protein n=1 Tax=Dentipellis fragilis TaxID=205917 RepID=A0A4Y9YSZ9_9AGAM|nr:hypothetical protein EVG20_g5642 [Dentipellis fragilis]